METSSMVERVAKAIYWSFNAETETAGKKTNPGQSRMFMGAARAAIQAMREMTDGQKRAACEVGPDTQCGCFDFDDAYVVYTAAIDAALKEE